MYEDEFPIRLAKLRKAKGVSARDMSLSLGQNQGYINNIETGKTFPSMVNFFYICFYLGITPQEFFDLSMESPIESHKLIDKIKSLNSEQLELLNALVDQLK